MAKQLHTNCCKKFLRRNFLNTIYLKYLYIVFATWLCFDLLLVTYFNCQYFVVCVGIWLEWWELPHLTDGSNSFISHLLSRAPLAAFHFWLLLSSFLVLFFCGKWSPTLPLPCIISSQQLRRWANHSESSHRSTIPWMCPDWVMDEPKTTLGFHLKERSNR